MTFMKVSNPLILKFLTYFFDNEQTNTISKQWFVIKLMELTLEELDYTESQMYPHTTSDSKHRILMELLYYLSDKKIRKDAKQYFDFWPYNKNESDGKNRSELLIQFIDYE